VDYNWLYSWIRRPADFRPSTRMPQFFLHDQHLNSTDKEFKIHDASGNEVAVDDREYTRRFENIEIRALAEFLLNNSQRDRIESGARSVAHRGEIEHRQRPAVALQLA
jgi:hypothetical protein